MLYVRNLYISLRWELLWEQALNQPFITQLSQALWKFPLKLFRWISKAVSSSLLYRSNKYWLDNTRQYVSVIKMWPLYYNPSSKWFACYDLSRSNIMLYNRNEAVHRAVGLRTIVFFARVDSWHSATSADFSLWWCRAADLLSLIDMVARLSSWGVLVHCEWIRARNARR